MDDNLEDVRREVENTRFALADKIERLENKIETTATTTLNPAYYVRTRPWPTLGVCAFLGWVVGRSLQSRATSNHFGPAQNKCCRSFNQDVHFGCSERRPGWPPVISSATRSKSAKPNTQLDPKPLLPPKLSPIRKARRFMWQCHDYAKYFCAGE